MRSARSDAAVRVRIHEAATDTAGLELKLRSRRLSRDAEEAEAWMKEQDWADRFVKFGPHVSRYWCFWIRPEGK